MSVSAVSSSPYAYTSRSSATPADQAMDSFTDALAATEETAAVSTTSSSGSSTATQSSVDSPPVVISRRDGSVAYAIDPARVRRLAPPTRDGVETLTGDLAKELDAAFAEAGLPADPPVSFTVDDTGVHAAGARDDLAAIDALIAENVELRRSIRVTHAITAQAYALENTKPEDSYRTVSDPQVAIERYLRMMEQQKATTMAFVYGGGSVAVTANGTAWPAGAV